MYPSICLNRFEIDTKLYVCCLYVSNSKGIISVCMVHLCWTEAKKYSYTINQYKSSNAIDVLFLFSFRECVLLRMPIEKKLVQLKEEGKKKMDRICNEQSTTSVFFFFSTILIVVSVVYASKLNWILNLVKLFLHEFRYSNQFHQASRIFSNLWNCLQVFHCIRTDWMEQAGWQAAIHSRILCELIVLRKH